MDSTAHGLCGHKPHPGLAHRPPAKRPHRTRHPVRPHAYRPRRPHFQWLWQPKPPRHPQRPRRRNRPRIRRHRRPPPRPRRRRREDLWSRSPTGPHRCRTDTTLRGRIVPKTFARKAADFLAQDGVVLFDNPDAFLICAFKRDTALCEPDPGATAPRQYDCRPGCGNTVRTDTHARLLRERADEVDKLAAHAPEPISKRLRTNAGQLRDMADTHDAAAHSAEVLT